MRARLGKWYHGEITSKMGNRGDEFRRELVEDALNEERKKAVKGTALDYWIYK